MNKKSVNFLIIVLIFLSLVSFLSSNCDSPQININDASKSKLQEIINIGPATAERIINSRPFNSLDDLIDVKYIGDIKLEEIKNEELACVEENKDTNNKDNSEEYIEKNETQKSKTSEEDTRKKTNSDKEENKSKKDDEFVRNKEYEYEKIPSENTEKNKTKTLNTIKLNPKSIKNKDNNKSLLDNIALIGLFCFFVVLMFLFGIKKIRQRKNEFR